MTDLPPDEPTVAGSLRRDQWANPAQERPAGIEPTETFRAAVRHQGRALSSKQKVRITIAAGIVAAMGLTVLAFGGSESPAGEADVTATTIPTMPSPSGSSAPTLVRLAPVRSGRTPAAGTKPASVTSSASATTSRSSASKPRAPKAVTVTAQPSDVDLAAGRPVTASSYDENYVGSNAVDGNTSTYWESSDPQGFPQRLQVDLGSVTLVGRIVMHLPPVSDWNKRTQTLTIYGSTGPGSSFTILGSAQYTFDATTGDVASISFPVVKTRYVRLEFTANSGWPAAQLSELDVYS